MKNWIFGRRRLPLPMGWRRSGFVDCLLTLAVTFAASGSDVITYSAGKLHHYYQFTTGSPTEDLLNPWEGGANAYVSASTNMYRALFGPTSAPPSINLVFHINRFEYQNYYSSQATLDAALSNGTYTVRLETAHDGTNIAALSFPTNAYPTAPHLTCFTAAQAVDSTAPFTVTWDAFAGATTNDQILLLVSPTSNESRTNYFVSPLPNQAGALNGTNRQFIIPAGSLPAGYSGYLKLSFLKVTDKNTAAYPGVAGYGGFGSVTLMPFKTVPPIGLPQIVQPPLNRTGAVASTVFFSTIATGGNLSYQWQKNGVPVANATSDVFTLPGLQGADAAAYSVVVSNSFGAVTSTPPASLTVVSGTVGAADPQFHPVSCPNNLVNVVRQQRDGKVLAGGAFTRALVRYNANGSVDSTFTLGTSLGAGQVSAMELLADGRILIGGSLPGYGEIWVGNLARLNPDGSLDTTFNVGGSGANQWVYAITLQPDGKILIGGDFTAWNGVARTNIARLNADGSLDTSFNAAANGRVTTIAVLPDGRIFAGGWFTTMNNQSRNRIAGLTSTGAIDPGFTISSGADGFVDVIKPQPDGRLLVGGLFNNYNGVLNRKIIRLLTNGVPDSTFVTGAGITSISGSSLGEVASIAVQPDNKIVLAGEFTFYTNSFDNNLVRLYPDGSKDTNFTAGTDAKVNSIVAPGDGSLLIGGNFSSYGGCYIARLLSDSGFAKPGILTGPASQTNTFGSVTTFSVSASGGALSYQWQKNGAPISGATNSSYVIFYTQDLDAGSYSVVVRNPAGSTTSAQAMLTVTVTPEFTWVTAGRGTNTTAGRGIVSDFFGNTYVAGIFYGTLTNLGTTVSSVAGGQDAFLVKFDPTGKPLWARSAGGSSLDSGWAVALDPGGNVLFAGTVRGTAAFGATNVTTAGLYDPFVAKYDSTGNLLWVRTGGGVATDRGFGVACDPMGNVFLSGFYNADSDFGTNHIVGAGTFIAKYSPNGTALWAKGISSSVCCNAGRAIATDAAGNVYMTGIFNDTVVFGTNLVVSSGINNNMFLAKYDGAGNNIWVRRSGGPDGGDAYGVAVGPDGNPVMTGGFYTAADFGPFNLVAASTNLQFFVAKYSADGVPLWVRQAGGSGDLLGTGIGVDPASRVWVTGQAAGTADFGGISFSAAGTAGNPDLFVTRYSAVGDLLTVYRGGGTNIDYGFGLALDGGGNAYIVGDYFGPQVAPFGNLSLTNSTAASDLFVLKLAPGTAHPALLATQSAPGLLTLSWSVAAANWTLVTAPGPGQPWTPIFPTRATNNGVISVILSTSATSSALYSLQHP